MAIIYPLAMPSGPAPTDASIYIVRNQTAAIGGGGVRQVQKNPGDKWVGKITLPTLSADQGAEWLGFFGSLDGLVGSFLFAHPDFKTMRGTASGQTGSVQGAGQKGNSLVIDGLTSGKTFKRGDIIQQGADNDSPRLKMVLEDATVAAGAVTLLIAPDNYIAPADNAVIITENCKGVFQLTDADIIPNSDRLRNHVLSFAIEEKLI